MITTNWQTTRVILWRHESGDMMDSFHRVVCSFWRKSLRVKILFSKNFALFSCFEVVRIDKNALFVAFQANVKQGRTGSVSVYACVCHWLSHDATALGWPWGPVYLGSFVERNHHKNNGCILEI